MPERLHPLLDYGYGGAPGYTDLRLLADHGVLIADVRRSAWSRVPRWRERELAAEFGASYVTLGSLLGNLNYNTGGPIKIADLEQGLRVLGGYLEESPVCLLCVCEEAEGCHRSVIVEAARKRFPCLVTRHVGHRVRLVDDEAQGRLEGLDA